MPKFTDEKGRDWVVRVDVRAIKHVRAALEIDLGSLGKVAENLIQFADDPVLLCNVLYVLCEEQAEKLSITDEDFGRLLAGDVILDATMALEDAITDFFPQQKRSLLQRLRKKVDRVQARGMDLVAERLDAPELEEKILAKMKARMDQAMSLTPSSSATTSPDKPEASTPPD